MFFSLFGVVFVIALVVALPVAMIAALRAFGMIGRNVGGAAIDDRNAIESRLTRIEDAIDAMAVQIERLRTEGDARYVSSGGVPRRLPSPDDEPPDA
jgi:hypothetical protein